MTCLDKHFAHNILAALLSELEQRLVALVMVVFCCFFLAESRAWSFAARPYPASQEQIEEDLEDVASALLEELFTAEEGDLGDHSDILEETQFMTEFSATLAFATKDPVGSFDLSEELTAETLEDAFAMVDCFHRFGPKIKIKSLPMHSPHFVYRQKNEGYEVASSESGELFQLACGGGGGVSLRSPARPSPPKPKIPKKALPAGIVGGALYIDQTRSDWAYETLKDRQTKAALEREIEEAIEIKNNPQLSDEEKEIKISELIEHAHIHNNRFKRKGKCPESAINNLNIERIRSKC